MPPRRWIFVAAALSSAVGLLAVGQLWLAGQPHQLTFTVPASASPHALTLTARGSLLELLDGATRAVLASQPLAGTLGVTIHGAPGNVDDALTVDLDGGPLALPDGIHFDGGAGGYDTLTVTGGPAQPGSYTATGPGSGVLTQGGTRITFTNLEPVTDTAPAANFTINATSGNDTINVVNGASCGAGCQTMQVNSPSFESIAFAHKTNVTINGLAGADTINLNSTLPATGLSKLVVDAGGNANDSIKITNFKLLTGTLQLTNAVTETESLGSALVVANLAARAASQVGLGGSGNQVTTVAGGATDPGGTFFFASGVPTVTVGSVAGVTGISTLIGSVVLENTNAGGALVVINAISTAGGALNLFADHMTFNAALNAVAATTWLDSWTVSEPIHLGTQESNTLGLRNSDLGHITAGLLQIGSVGSDTGGLTVTAPITAPVGWSTLELQQKSDIVGFDPGWVRVANLALRVSGGNVFFSNNFGHVGTLAGETTGGSFSYGDRGGLTIGTVAGVHGISTAGGEVDIGAQSGGLTVTQNISSGAGMINLIADESTSPADNFTLASGAVVSSTNNEVVLWAGDQARLQPGSVAEAGGIGNVIVAFSVEDTDNIGGGYIAGTVNAATKVPQASGGDADETLLVDFNAGANLPIGLLYDGGNGLNALTVSDAGGSAPHLYEASGTGASRDLANLIHFSRIENLTIIGGSAADSFGIRPDAGVTIHVVGGLPGSAPGDDLLVFNISAINPALAITGFDSTGASGHWSFGNRLPINFSGIDTFDNLNNRLYLPLVRK